MTATRVMPTLALAILLVGPFLAGDGVQAQLPIAIEGFEDCAILTGTPPCDATYTYLITGTGSAYVTDVESVGASDNSLAVQNANTLAFNTYQQLTTSNWCVVGMDFWFRPDTMPATGQSYYLAFGNGGSGQTPTATEDLVSIRVNSDGTMTVLADADGTAQVNAAFGFTLAVDTWYHFGIRCLSNDFDGEYEQAQFVEYTTNSAPVTLTLPLNDNFVQEDIVVFAAHITAQPFGSRFYLDDITFGLRQPPTVVAAATTSALTGVTGFDVDPTGATAIARTDDGENVRVWPAGSLGGTVTKDTNCAGGDPNGEYSGLGGVAAGRSHVIYFDCRNDDAGEIHQLEIRSPALTSPSLQAYCNDAGFCLEDIETECGVITQCVEGDQDENTYISILEEFPIDYTRMASEFLSEHVYMAMAFADEDGSLGVWTYIMKNNDVDVSDITSVGITSQSPDQICTHRDPNGRTYLYGASTESNPRGFEVTFEFTGGMAVDTLHLVPVMRDVTTFPGSTSGARGVACGDFRVALLTSTTLTIWNRTENGNAHFYRAISGLTQVPSKALAMDKTGRFVAYVSADKWHVYDINAGHEVAQAAVAVDYDAPATKLVGMELTGCGGDLWVAYRTDIDRFPISTYTVGEECTYNILDDPTDVDGDGISNQEDPDIDGDGKCNAAITTPMPLGTPGALNGCVVGDTDDDGDSVPNGQDNTPGGVGVSTAAVSNAGWGMGSQVALALFAFLGAGFVGGLFSKWNAVVAGSSGFVALAGVVFWKAHDLWVLVLLGVLVAIGLIVARRR